MKRVQIITDGSCIGNPGPGGWAAILRHGDKKREIYGSEPETTNITDSNYVKHGITEWIHRWKSNGWRTSGKKPVVNQDLWHALDELASQHHADWVWTKGHASHADNNRCDELAQAAARGQLSSES
jgi:ribonuclease HI